MGRGISSDEIPSSDGGGFIRHIRLKADGESCRIRFLTEHDEIFWERFHRNMVSGQYRGQVLCVKSAFGQACSKCEGDESTNNKPDRAGTQFLAWAFEYAHFYPEKPAKIETKKVKIGTMTFYMEEVNEPRLMRYSIMHRGGIKARAERHGTIMDSPFEWIRTNGSDPKKPTYTLEALDKEKMPAELKELISTLPDLEDIALGKVERLDGEESDSRKVREVKDEEEDEPNDFVKKSKVKEPASRKVREVEEEAEEPGEADENPFS